MQKITNSERRAIADFTRPWSERRGLESMESHSGSILVQASIDELADALTPIAIESKRDVLGVEIESSGCFVLAFQIVGQQWSGVLPDWIYDPQPLQRCSRPNAAQISRIAERPVIDFQVSDTVGGIGYQLFEKGELIEYFSGSEDEDPFDERYGSNAQYYELTPYPDENEDWPLIQMARFWSKDRQVTAQEIGNIWTFPDQFLRDRNAYEPAMDVRYFLGDYSPRRNKRYRIRNPGITLSTGRQEVTAVPELVRIDYFRFGT